MKIKRIFKKIFCFIPSIFCEKICFNSLISFFLFFFFFFFSFFFFFFSPESKESPTPKPLLHSFFSSSLLRIFNNRFFFKLFLFLCLFFSFYFSESVDFGNKWEYFFAKSEFGVSVKGTILSEEIKQKEK